MHQPCNHLSSRLPNGQPPQHLPSLGPNPALGGPYCIPHPGYGVPQRNNPAPGSLVPSVSSQSEVGLDPSNFPMLGATLATREQHGRGDKREREQYDKLCEPSGMGAGGSGGQTGSGLGANQQRELTVDDFPALGGQSQTTQ
ncbi:hypothetical protein LXA43DRAFT_1067456 [Ganoderma leucocontextum]|nr:hypothetical protein LXA43DRAFT_1067456 [Ganoderma leucocontextum]